MESRGWGGGYLEVLVFCVFCVIFFLEEDRLIAFFICLIFGFLVARATILLGMGACVCVYVSRMDRT